MCTMKRERLCMYTCTALSRIGNVVDGNYYRVARCLWLNCIKDIIQRCDSTETWSFSNEGNGKLEIR